MTEPAPPPPSLTKRQPGPPRLLARVVALMVAGAFLWSATLPGAVGGGYRATDPAKLGHVLAFAALALVLRAAFAGCDRPGWWTLATSLGVAIAMEVIQGSVPGRTGDVRDLVFDGLGALLVVVFAARFRRP